LDENENIDKRISNFKKMNLAIDLEISIEKLEKLIRYERRRNRKIKNKDKIQLNKENAFRTLKNFYYNIRSHPNKTDIEILSNELNMDTKKIRNWFTRERFRANTEKKIKQIISASSSTNVSTF
jgi:hypothetical protein